MAQSISRPAYMFIPKPIEQRLTAYQLGTLLEVYQLGWNRGTKRDSRISKWWAFLAILGGLPVSIVSIIGVFDVVQATGILQTNILLIPSAGIVSVAVGIFLLFQNSFCVAAFSEGLVYAKNTRVTVLHWTEIKSFEQKIKKSWYALFRVSILHCHNGKRLKWRDLFSPTDNLGKVIRECIG